jgi:D-alanyl-lipoteichoic acid acyltransferase DltB (MBOAT superfamily)
MICDGILRIFFGLFKVTLLAVALQPSAGVFAIYEGAAPWEIWGLLFIYTWYFYINFSGYSDLAIGIARLFGFRLNENFSYPYFRKNIADYWNNWHISLSHFAQRNVYVPMGGYRPRTQYLALFATIMVIALWHNISLGMVVFGTYHGMGLIVHRLWSQRQVKTESLISDWGSIALTYLFVAIGFPLLILPLPDALNFYAKLAGV